MRLSRRAFLAGAAVSLLRSAEMQGPILQPDQPWEGSCAMPFGGGIWQTRGGWRCYYLANFYRVCLAFSDDGLTWRKPDLGVVPGTNILLEIPDMDSFSVWPDPAGGWAMCVSKRSGGGLKLFRSLAGLWWVQVGEMPWAGDRTTIWHNRVKNTWVFNVRAGAGTGGDPRRIDRVESASFVPAVWELQPWLKAQPGDGVDDAGSVQLYAVDVVPDGDRLVGLFTIWRGLEDGRPKLNDVCLGFSKDGDDWAREFDPVLTRGRPGSWHWGNVQSVTGGLVRVGRDRVRIYASGRDGRDGGNGVCSLGYREIVL